MVDAAGAGQREEFQGVGRTASWNHHVGRNILEASETKSS